MKKWMGLLLALVMILVGCVGCGKETPIEGTDAAVQETVPDEKEEPAVSGGEAAEQEEPEEKEGPAVEQPEEKEEEVEMPPVEKIVDRIIADINVGWNLGNSLDAHTGKRPAELETAWGNPETTKAMIDAVKEAGFNTVRVPVTWYPHLGAAPEYKIDDAWMDRVEEVVNYALDNDMYVILDTHHEPDNWLIPQKEKKEEVLTEFTAIWGQIAERFRDYGEKLIFEGMNEARVKGSAEEWSGGTQEGRGIVNLLNQTFVDTVRATGGGNANRVLIISSYGHSVAGNSLKDMILPEDENIAVAVHMYTPYLFTYEDNGSYAEWDGSKKGEIASAMRSLNTFFISRGIPVIITEFGAVDKKIGQESNEQEVIKWLEDYMSVTNEYGIKCVWWDNGNYSNSGEKFAIFNRNTLEWYRPAVVETLMRLSAPTE